MGFYLQLLLPVLGAVYLTSCRGETFDSVGMKWPTIGVSILVRNKEQTLPFFLTTLYQQDYPKNRMYIWIYTDHNKDQSATIIDEWVKKHSSEYHKVVVTSEKPVGAALHKDQSHPSEWTKERMKHVISLREKALNFGRKMWADFVFMLDADVFLTEPSALKHLVSKHLPIVAPMLVSDGLYSNFWGAMTENYYYQRSEEYEEINGRDKLGCFPVPMVHSAVLIYVRTEQSERLTYNPDKVENYTGPIDDIIAFALSASGNDVNMTVCNDQLYGFVTVPVDINTKENMNESELFLNVKMEALSRGVVLPLEPSMAKWVSYPPRDKMGCDQIYMINLERRLRRRQLMEESFKELGIEAVTFKAIDGKNINLQDLSHLSINLMPNYEDPYHKRPMKTGEVGCFLSHFAIWKQIAKKHIGKTLVLEDDVHFTPFFRRRFREMMEDLETLDWDFVYIGRKILQEGKEEYVTSHLTRPLYSYWTLGYLISETGARKLIKAEPLSKLLPVDEFLPIMFDEHPNGTWKSYFPVRELKALSVTPLLVTPTHYTGQEGYISDTEDSDLMATLLYYDGEALGDDPVGHSEL